MKNVLTYGRLACLGLVLPTVALASSLRLVPVNGDREIIVGKDSGTQVTVRVVDEFGAPRSGVYLFIYYSDPSYYGVWIRDEFGFRGFNMLGADVSCSGPLLCPTLFQITDAAGEATVRLSLEFTPAAVTIGARVLSNNLSPDPTVAPLVLNQTRVAATPPATSSVALEYFHAPTKHYFVTADHSEVEALDGGKFSGWQRSIGSFIVYLSLADAPPGAQSVCRFFSAQFTSHFYTADSDECDAVIAKWPDIWKLETRNAFYINVPDKVTGRCAVGFQPVYRLFNNQPSPNHRYVTDAKLRDTMVTQGWSAEGYGPESVMLCTPA